MKFSIYIFLMALFLCPILQGQTNPSNENYVLQTQYQVPVTTDLPNTAVNNDKKIESIVYYDGLGRPKQSVAIRAGGNREDLVTPVLYDPLGRQPKEFLPLPLADNYGAFNNNTTVGGQLGVTKSLEEYYQTKFEDDFPQGLVPGVILNPYSEKRFENSPLNRVLEQAAPGYDWLMKVSDEDHTIKFEYGTNTATEVRRFYVTYQSGSNVPILHLETSSNSYYPKQTLIKSVTKDENWRPEDGTTGTTIEYTNKLGQVVLKRVRGYEPESPIPDYSYHTDTYYIYDDFGSLVFVLSPEGSDRIVSNNALIADPQPILDNLCYQYRYDYRNRLVWKKLPGKGFETILYNNLNRPVLTQDANMREENPNKYLFTKYDGLGRVAYTGFYTSPIPKQAIEDSLQNKAPASIYENQRTTAQGPVQIGDTQVYYSSSSFPYDNLQVLTINYYDEYVDYTVPGNNGLTLPTTVMLQNTTEHASVATTTNGLPTVSKVRVLGQTPAQWTTSLSVYDSRGRAIYSDSYNEYLESRDILASKLELITGRPIETYTTHSKENNAINISEYFAYDHMGRLLSQKQKIDASPLQLIAQNEYDELGQLVRKNVGGETEFDGYTLTNAGATYDGTVFKSGTADSWDSGAKTKGKVIGNGGIEFTISQEDKLLRAGLQLSTNTSTSWTTGYDYALYFLNTDADSDGHKDMKVIKNGAELPTVYEYDEGDSFTITRSGTSVFFKRAGEPSPFLTLNGQTATAGLLGKVGFKSPSAQVTGFDLFGGNIDKKLQEVDYAYNIRGWLTDINDIDPEPTGGLGMADLFNFRINYNTVEGNATNDPLFNGNISQTLWKTANTDSKLRGYAYSYDDLNRITGADSYKGTTLGAMVSNTDYTLEGIHFDKNGNILSLKRRGANESAVPSFGQWDDLEYTYEDNGNKLMKVDENSSSFTYHNFGFKDGTNTGDDYEYDDNGNMKKDLNKEIYNITYNHLNLPEVINFDEVSSIPSIHYVYDAVGTKLCKWVSEEGTIRTEYANGFVYNNAGTGQMELQFFSQAEGYVKPVAGTDESVEGYDKDDDNPTSSTYKYVFQYKDHLGNVRLSYSDGNLDGAINPATEIIEESNYYPFGLRQKGYNTTVSPSGNSLAQQYKFGGKESQEELDLNTYDFGWRNYDPALGRWMNIDNLSEEYVSLSPYSYVMNSPLVFVDPDGQRIIIGDNDYEYEEDRDYDKINEEERDIYRALDVLYQNATITVGEGDDAEKVNFVQNLIDYEFKAVEIKIGGEHSFDPMLKDEYRSEVSFNSGLGVEFYTDPDDTSKKGRNSPTGALAHELIHAYNYNKDSKSYLARRRDETTRGKITTANGLNLSFTNKEEEYTTTLTNQVLTLLNEDSRNNYGVQFFLAKPKGGTAIQSTEVLKYLKPN